MPRYFITIEYDGGGYVGWQRQNNGASVQGHLEVAACAILGQRQEVMMQGAGRTDAGVHATGQVAHCDLPSGFTEAQLPLALNAHLPSDIRVVSARQVPDDAHARFDAIRRAYRYRIFPRKIASALLTGRVWHFPYALDVEAMAEAAKRLIGKHDFTSFRATHCQANSPIRTLDTLDIQRVGEEIILTVSARSFLHHQVRNITGSLVMVGQGKWTADDISTILEARDRAAAGQTAPPEGLYLTEVSYPKF
jgi:tRNA pseudouridine38-40 synthase